MVFSRNIKKGGGGTCPLSKRFLPPPSDRKIQFRQEIHGGDDPGLQAYRFMCFRVLLSLFAFLEAFVGPWEGATLKKELVNSNYFG